MPGLLLRSTLVVLIAATACSACPEVAAAAKPQAAEVHHDKSYSFKRGGWTYVHLEGTPREIGYEHGTILSAEIEDMYHVLKLENTHSTHQGWDFFRDAAKTVLWPHIDPEYQQELQGIAEGLKARGSALDVWDIVAMNGSIELSDYYVPYLVKQHQARLDLPSLLNDPAHTPLTHAPGNCSAMIATGSYTKDGKIVIAHNNWSSYAEGARWTIVFDIVPEHGHRMVMDGAPGLITSQDDFGINDAGLMITETTITQFAGWNSDGKPEFMRSRKAMQYADSIDSYVKIMIEGNNGGYANDWLIGDRKTGEIAYLELGLQHTPVWRKKDGYFVSSNYARDPGVIKDETPGFDPEDKNSSPVARQVRWEEEMAANRGKIDVAMAEKFMADHEDSVLGREEADQRSLCGHIDNAKGGVPQWDLPAYSPFGAVQGKVADASMAANMSFVAHAGHPCGEDFLAAPFLAAHPEFAWQAPILIDMKASPWTVFSAGQKAQ